VLFAALVRTRAKKIISVHVGYTSAGNERACTRNREVGHLAAPLVAETSGCTGKEARSELQVLRYFGPKPKSGGEG
jgi:hypothetical protein